ncbi:BRCA2 and CDKN1A-interacting protein-like [Ylistrum balloti]|uniref:BRCA2 and CDKN1A-interacting protein-like n=1 Tax=Ylistrum balloti TaxID=509963 RepID=UPI002905F0E9|nr:BRCA2 and CDKN1A-interacting protein-like [Ylistrum balloti]
MASKKKRVAEPMSTDTLESDSNGSSDDDYDEDEMDDENSSPINEEVQVEFEARMLDDSDFHGVKTLLQQVFLKANVNLSELTNTLISQNFIGCVIKQMDVPDDDDDDDGMDDDDSDAVFGVMSVVNITEKKDLECVQQVRSLLLDNCKACAKEKMSRFSDMLHDSDQHVGLLLSERYLNIPPQISVPMYDSLIKDIEKCQRKQMKYTFARYVMISKTYRMKGVSKQKEEPIIFSNSEEELLHEASELSFTYSVEGDRDTVVGGKWDSDNPMEALRTVMVIPADQLSVALTRIKAELAST